MPKDTVRGANALGLILHRGATETDRSGILILDVVFKGERADEANKQTTPGVGDGPNSQNKRLLQSRHWP